MRRLVVSSGDNYGRLTIVCEVEQQGRWRFVQVNCECGTIKIVRLNDLRSGKTTSCGCYCREMMSAAKTTHGLSGTPEYHAWWDMVIRCTDSTHSAYRLYGGRGITVCDEWLTDPTPFVQHVGMKPHNRYTLDRIDNNKGYFPGNVRWVARRVNQCNRSISKRWTVNGAEYESLGVAALSEGVSQSTIKQWCSGWKCYRTGKLYPPRYGCSMRMTYD